MVMEEEVTGVPEGSRYLGIVGCLVRLKNSQKDLKFQYVRRNRNGMCNEIDLECEAKGWASESWAPPATSDGAGAKLFIKSFRTILAFLVASNLLVFFERQCRIGKKLCHWKQKLEIVHFL